MQCHYSASLFKPPLEPDESKAMITKDIASSDLETGFTLIPP
jgi:hypothetical protein